MEPYGDTAGENRTPRHIIEKKDREENKRYEEESMRLKKLKLKSARDTEYSPWLRTYVPRARLVGSDGIVRTRRLRNEDPTQRPKDSEYGRLFSAFYNIRKQGVDAKWNVLGQTYIGYYFELPDDRPGLFHWKADGSLNDPLSTGIEWTRDWECVQDCVLLDAIGDSVEISEKILNTYGFKTLIDPYKTGSKNSMALIFRGSGEVCSGAWDWVSNCMSENPVEPPPIG
jgi:hypothetical protein